jgi:hypothetical protein
VTTVPSRCTQTRTTRNHGSGGAGSIRVRGQANAPAGWQRPSIKPARTLNPRGGCFWPTAARPTFRRGGIRKAGRPRSVAGLIAASARRTIGGRAQKVRRAGEGTGPKPPALAMMPLAKVGSNDRRNGSEQNASGRCTPYQTSKRSRKGVENATATDARTPGPVGRSAGYRQFSLCLGDAPAPNRSAQTSRRETSRFRLAATCSITALDGYRTRSGDFVLV